MHAKKILSPTFYSRIDAGAICVSRARRRIGQAMLWLGTFAFDATPPLGHSCCGGFGGADCLPIGRVDDALEAIGVVLIAPDELPVVLMALDWGPGWPTRRTLACAPRWRRGRVPRRTA